MVWLPLASRTSLTERPLAALQELARDRNLRGAPRQVDADLGERQYTAALRNESWRKIYGTKRWKDTRRRALIRVGRACQFV